MPPNSHTKSNPIRSVTCRRCGHVFGIDAKLGVSEVAGCSECPENEIKTQKEMRDEQTAIAK